MVKFVVKLLVFFLLVSIGMCGVCIKYDPAHIFSDSLVKEMTSELSHGSIISVGNANIDERVFQKYRLSNLGYDVDTIVLGSSRIMYLPITDNTWYNAGVSAATLDDLYGIIGLIDYYNLQVKRIIIGVDPWIFNPNTGGVEYKSIIPFINYERDICTNNSNAQLALEEWNWQFTFERIKMAYSPAYFQSAISSLRKDFSVKIEEDTEPSSVSKILPSGQRIPETTMIHDPNKNAKSAQQAVDNETLYYIDNFDNLNMDYVEAFEALINHIQNKDIKIEFFLPPWYPTHFEEIKSNHKYAGVIMAENYIRHMAEMKGIIVRGGYDPSLCGVESDDFMDTLHVKPEKLIEVFQYINSINL